MLRPMRWLQGLCLWSLGTALVPGMSGCCCVKQEDPLKELRPLGKAIPMACRNHCYLFFVHSCDPFDTIDLGGLVERVQQLGYIKTYEGDILQNRYFAEEMRRIHKEDPTARFVLLGEGMGARKVHELAGTVGSDGIGIDLLVYLDGSGTADRKKQPIQALQVLNIRSKGGRDNNLVPDHAVNVTSEVGGYGLASNKKTVELLLRELLQVASRVPVIEKVPRPNPHPGPTPVPVKPVPDGPHDAWDFLKPEVQGTPSPPASSKPPPPLPKTPPPGGGPVEG